MEVKEGTLVVIISGSYAKNYCLGLVVKILTNDPFTGDKYVHSLAELKLNKCDAATSRVYTQKKDLFPLVEDCTLEDLEGILKIAKLPEMIRNFVLLFSGPVEETE